MARRTLIISIEAQKQYLEFKNTQPRLAKKIDSLIASIYLDPEKGIGKPEQLKHAYAGYWSRRISARDRLIYRFTASEIVIIKLKDHYQSHS